MFYKGAKNRCLIVLAMVLCSVTLFGSYEAAAVEDCTGSDITNCLDYRAYNWVTPPKQEWPDKSVDIHCENIMCAVCRTFALVGALESQVAKAMGVLVDLAVQDITSCGYSWGPEQIDNQPTGNMCGMAQGGQSGFLRNVGVGLEMFNLYTGIKDGNCPYCSSYNNCPTPAPFRATSITVYPNPNHQSALTKDELKAKLRETGPVVVGMGVFSDFYPSLDSHAGQFS